jgi:hypothetical protein
MVIIRIGLGLTASNGESEDIVQISTIHIATGTESPGLQMHPDDVENTSKAVNR